MEYVLKFDTEKPNPDLYMVIIYTLAITIISNVIFIVICAIFRIDSNASLDREKNEEYKIWKSKKISIWSLIVTELFNNSIYSPIAEEFALRFLFLKVILVKRMRLNPEYANIIQGLTFGLLHIANVSSTLQTKTYTYLQAMSAGIAGMISGWVYIHSNSILPSLFSHMINNGAAGIGEIIGYIKYLKK